MYQASRIRETTTKSGAITVASTLTLLGAVPQHNTFASRVQVGDPCPVTLRDAGGSVWIQFEATLTDSTTLTIDTIKDSSAGLGTGVTLSAGTHEVMDTFSADQANKVMIFGDAFLDHVVSGLVVPTSASLVAVMSAGIAYAVGQRVKKGAQSKTYTASKDTYVDLSNIGTLTYPEVTLGAAAPALTANSIRLAKVVTSGSAVTSVVTTGRDSLGNNIRNLIRTPTCILLAPYNLGTSIAHNADVAVPFGSGTESVNNDGMHSTVTNNTRATVQHAGLYDITGVVQYGNGAGGVTTAGTCYSRIFVNGAAVEGADVSVPFASGDFPGTTTQHRAYFNAGDYIELFAKQVNVVTTHNIIRGALRVARIG